MKTAILITARLKSTRLPMKVIKKIHGKPMIVHMLNRLKLAKKPDEIIICTSTIEQDDALEEIAFQENVRCFRGHPDDVLLRLTDAAKKFNVDLIINCTADNPFVDPEYIDLLIDHHKHNSNDFSKIEGLPWGTFSYAINLSAMKKACSIKDEVDTEVWHGYFMDTKLFKWTKLVVKDDSVLWPDLRLTVDTPEDFILITKIFDALYDKQVFKLKDIVSLCREHPELPAINNKVLQKAGKVIKIKDDLKN